MKNIRAIGESFNVPYPQKRIPGRKSNHFVKEDTVKINFGTQILGVDNKAVDDEEKNPLILKKVCINALLGNAPGENIPGEEKYKRYKLFRRIDESVDGFAEVSSEEITLLKALIGKLYLPLVVGRAYDALEGQKDG